MAESLTFSNYHLNEMHLERSKPEQASEILQLVNECYGNFFNRYLEERPENVRLDMKGVVNLINHESLELYVLVNKVGQVVGTIVYNPNGEKKSAWFGLFSLHPSARKNGVGGEMIKWMENIALQNHKQKMKLDVSGFATPLQNHYIKNGYAPTGKKIPFEKGIHWTLKPEYKEAPNKDFVIMAKKL